MTKARVRISFILFSLMMLTLVATVSAATTGKTPAEPGAQPWMVALVDSSRGNAHEGQFCGGSLIAPDWVLTASHCLEGIQDAGEVDVVIGRHQLSSSEGERIQAAELFVHTGYPSYEDGEDNDIGLIRLSRPAAAGTPIQLVNDANEYVDDPGAMARVTGWGVLNEEDEATPDILHGVNLPVVSQAACQNVYGADLLDDTLCAGPENGGGDSCYGDSGGPLVGYDNNGTPVQIGIVSWGEECGASGQYGVYVRLTEYESWINGVMAGTVTTMDPADIAIDNDWSDDDSWDDEAGWVDDDWSDEGDWDDDYWGNEGNWDDDWSDDQWDDDDWSDDDDWDDDYWGDEGDWDDGDWQDDDDWSDNQWDDSDWFDIDYWAWILGW